MSLSTQTGKINAIIDMPDKWGCWDIYLDIYEKLKIFLAENSKMWAFVYHDRDIKDVDGEIIAKTPHIHMVALMNDTRKRLSTWLKSLSIALGINESCITIKVLSSFDGSLAYFVHKFDPQKFQYSVSDITSCVPQDEIISIIDNYDICTNGDLSVDSLVEFRATISDYLDQ